METHRRKSNDHRENNNQSGMNVVMAPHEPLSLKKTPEIRLNPAPVHKELKPQSLPVPQAHPNPPPSSQPRNYSADVVASASRSSSAARPIGHIDALLEAARQAQGKIFH